MLCTAATHKRFLGTNFIQQDCIGDQTQAHYCVFTKVEIFFEEHEIFKRLY